MINENILPPGKLPMSLLKNLLTKYTNIDQSVIMGPGIGNDAAVIEIGDTYLVAKTDPITFVTADIGHYVININANDIACLGGTPKWLLVTLLLPENHTTRETVEDIFGQINQSAQRLGISICGGHTEITHGIDRPIVVGQMLGTVPKNKLVRPSGIRPGDDIILTKGIAIEGTSIIAREKYNEIQELFSEEYAKRCADFLFQPGISVLRDARIALSTAPIHAMHDPTEGGLATGLHELAQAADVSLRIEMLKIPILPESKLLCDEYGLDLMGTIASGALLIVTPTRFSQKLVDKLELEGIAASIIGKVVSKGSNVQLVLEKEAVEMPYFAKDEILKLY